MLLVLGSGTKEIFNKNFSSELVKRLINVQESLLRKAINLVNLGGIIIYSTCSILKDENERILDKVKHTVQVLPLEEIKDNNLSYVSGDKNSLTICPNEYFEGFFIAKLRKI